MAVMYSLFHVVADNVLPEGEGDGTMEAVKSCVSGAATGALYKSGEKMQFYLLLQSAQTLCF